MDRADYFFVIVGQLIDDAMIGGLLVRLTLSDGGVVEGFPGQPASDISQADELNDTGYARWVDLAGVRVELAAVRQAAIVYPTSAV